MKIMKTVANSSSAQKHDVMLVQMALSEITLDKSASKKALYTGSIDGNPTATLQTAISSFQSSQKLTVTGKVETSGATLSKLGTMAPSAKKFVSIPGGVISTSQLIKIKQAANAEANRITRKEPLPNMQAETLSQIVKKAGAIGIPLIVTKSDIDTNSGRLIVEMDIPLGSTTVHKALKQDLIPEVCRLFNGTKGWAKGDSTDLKFQSAVSYDFLKAKTLPSELMQPLLLKVPSAPKGRLTNIALSAASYVLKTTPKGHNRNIKLYIIADIIRPSSKKLADEIVSFAPITPNASIMRIFIYLKLHMLSKLNMIELMMLAGASGASGAIEAIGATVTC